jgi:hypothetical protein
MLTPNGLVCDSDLTHGNTNYKNMRIKTLFCLAALAAGSAVSMAQSNVYSLNIVGYVTVTNPPGYRLMANPLNTTNNDVSKLIAAPPTGTTIYKRSGNGYLSSTYDPDFGGWGDLLQLNPGEGYFVQNPGAAFVNTYVGEVVLDSTNSVPSGYSIRSSVIPQTGPIQTALGYTPGQGDTIYFFTGSGYTAYGFDPDFGGWYDGEPSPAVGQGFWIYNNGAPKSWIRHFSVGP